MSVAYHKEIFSNGTIKISINFTGADSQDIINASECNLEIFAYDASTYKLVFSEKLNLEQVRELYSYLHQISIIKDHTRQHTEKFIEADGEILEFVDQLQKKDKTFIKRVLDKVVGVDGDKLSIIIDSLSQLELENLDAAINQTTHKNSLKNLQILLELEEKGNIVEQVKLDKELSKYQAGQPEKIFQNWIESNLWALGIRYIKKHDWKQIGLTSEADLVMESTDGFIDLIELKRPKMTLFSYDKDHKNYYPSPELSAVIGQALLYLKTLEEYKLILEKTHEVKILKPRIRIIASRSSKLLGQELETLRLLNTGLPSIDITCYDQLVNSSETIISSYEK